jgi:hypothetical protein
MTVISSTLQLTNVTSDSSPYIIVIDFTFLHPTIREGELRLMSLTCVVYLKKMMLSV